MSIRVEDNRIVFARKASVRLDQLNRRTIVMASNYYLPVADLGDMDLGDSFVGDFGDATGAIDFGGFF